jgi:hypothetical protein
MPAGTNFANMRSILVKGGRCRHSDMASLWQPLAAFRHLSHGPSQARRRQQVELRINPG